jgi:uncharacterized membrane protein
MTRIIDFFRHPARVFVVLALLAGTYLACVVPHFAGIDEPAHFYRAYQISTGHFVPVDVPGKNGFSGACAPLDVIVQQQRASFEFYIHNAAHAGVHVKDKTFSEADVPRCPGDPSQGFVTFSTFGSPVPYAPQAVTALVMRGLGADAETMLIAMRFAVLFTYVAVVWWAIRRSPRSKWALCAVGLLPVALIQAGGTVSHDALTTGVSLLVLSSALRALDPPEGVSNRALIIEALLLSALLGSCKPVYVVIAFCYLLPLVGRTWREEWRTRWPLALAPVVGVLATMVWTAAVGNLWKTDAGYFGIRVDDAFQRHQLLHRPWDFAGDFARSVWNQGLGWMKTVVDVGPSVTHWGWLIAVPIFVVYALVAMQRDRAEPEAGLSWAQRLLVALVFVVGVVGVAAGMYLYYTEPGASEIFGIQPRYLVPLLPLIPVAIGALRARWARAATTRFPIGVLLVPVLLVFVVSVTYRMY